MLAICRVNDCLEGRICANSVVVTVSTDKRTVKTNVTSLKCRNDGKLSGEKILLNDAVFIVKNFHCVKLNCVIFISKRSASHKDVELFAFNSGAQGLGAVISCKVGKKVVYVENGVVVVLTDNNVNACSVRLNNNTVKCQGNSEPLIFTDTAVVVRFKEAHALVFIEGNGLNINSW